VLIVLWLVALLVRTLKVEVAAVVVMEHPFVVEIGEEKQAV